MIDGNTPIHRVNTDPRILSAANIYHRHQSGLVKVYKTARAGCTTSLGAEAINRGEKTLMVVPTNKIARDTIIRDIPLYTDAKKVKIVQIVSNLHCNIIKQMVEQYPDLAQLRMLLLPVDDCRSCEYFDVCEVTEFVRVRADVLVVTAQKLATMMQKFMSSRMFEDLVREQLDIILDCRNVILDEIHLLQLMEMRNITVEAHSADGSKKMGEAIKLDKYTQIVKKEYKAIYEILQRFKTIRESEDLNGIISTVVESAKSETYYHNHIRHTIDNPVGEETLKKNQSKIFNGVCNELVDLVRNRRNLKLSMYDIDKIYDILTLTTAQRISVGAVRSENHISVSLSSADMQTTRMLQQFVNMALEGHRRVILTSATIDDSVYDYDELSGTKKAVNVVFGENGDPLNTNEKMLIIADSKKYHKTGELSVYNNREEICNKIIEVMKEYGFFNCFIVAVNRETAKMLEDELKELGYPATVTYYKADDTIGVQCNARICIAIGFAYKPSNVFDTITATVSDSKRLLEVSMQSDTFQGICRVKDPEGKEPSAVICLGVRKQECENTASWGTDRRTVVSDVVNGKKTKIEVKHNQDITKVRVVECKTWDLVKTALKIHMHKTSVKQLEEIASENGVKPLVFTHYRGFVSKSEAIISDSGFIDKIMIENPSFDWLNTCLGAGAQILTHTVLQGMSKTIFFEDVGEDRIKLCSYLSTRRMDYTLEEQNGKYHVRVYTELMKAQDTKALAKKIMKEAKIKCGEVYPKKISTNLKRGFEYPETIPLPFGNDCTNIIHQEFFDVKETNAEYERVDIKSYVDAGRRIGVVV